MAAASTGHVQSFFKLNFRCIENKYTFNTIREAKEEDTVGNLISTVLDTDSIDCMMIDHVVSGLTEDSATFQTNRGFKTIQLQKHYREFSKERE